MSVSKKYFLDIDHCIYQINYQPQPRTRTFVARTFLSCPSVAMTLDFAVMDRGQRRGEGQSPSSLLPRKIAFCGPSYSSSEGLPATGRVQVLSPSVTASIESGAELNVVIVNVFPLCVWNDGEWAIVPLISLAAQTLLGHLKVEIHLGIIATTD